MARIVDLTEWPDHNPAVYTTQPKGLDSVSKGLVSWDPDQKAVCSKHGAMNCVSADRRIWRCVHAYTCREAGYIAEF